MESQYNHFLTQMDQTMQDLRKELLTRCLSSKLFKVYLAIYMVRSKCVRCKWSVTYLTTDFIQIKFLMKCYAYFLLLNSKQNKNKKRLSTKIKKTWVYTGQKLARTCVVFVVLTSFEDRHLVNSNIMTQISLENYHRNKDFFYIRKCKKLQ
jgi:hypothetical protein